MANRYWIAGTGLWSNTSSWSTTSGGSGGASIPTTSDTVVFDANSFSSTGTVTISIDASCNNFDSSDLDQHVTFDISSTERLVIAGAMNTQGSETFNNGLIIFGGGGTRTVDVAGVDLNTEVILNRSFFGGFPSALWTISDMDVKTFKTLDSAIDISNSTINVGDWLIDGPVTSTNSTINVTREFKGGNRTYNTVKALANITIRQSNNINTLQSNTGVTLTFESSSTQTITNWQVLGAPDSLVRLRSTGSVAKFTLSKASGIVRTDYLDIKNSNATGGASWFAGNNSVDSGGN